MKKIILLSLVLLSSCAHQYVLKCNKPPVRYTAGLELPVYFPYCEKQVITDTMGSFFLCIAYGEEKILLNTSKHECTYEEIK